MAKTIKIGHASQSEFGSTSGVAGDSTGKEVCIDPNNDITRLGYHVLLRPKTSELAEKSAKACEAGCSNNKIGYSQSGRTSLYNEAKEVNFDLTKITTACNTDCSAFMAVCAIAGGADVSPSSTTRSMRVNFKNSGSYEVKTDSIYFTSSDYLKRGDILVKEGSHTVMILSNGGKVPAISALKDNLEWQEDFFAIKIVVNVTNVSATKLQAEVKITKIEAGKEKTLNGVDTYEWSYELFSLSNSNIKAVSKEFKLSASTTTFYVDKLIPGCSYFLKVTAKEKSGKATFSSPNIIFTVPKEQKPTNNDTNIEFKDVITIARKCKTYVKLKDTFKRAIVNGMQ